MCAGCGERAAGLKLCARCRGVQYCGAECQRAHWRAHKKTCSVQAAALEDAKLLGSVSSEATLLAAKAKADARDAKNAAAAASKRASGHT